MKAFYDVLVIGSGIAGLTAAIKLREAGISTLVISKEADPTESNTKYAQGGIITQVPGDTPRQIMEDIHAAGMHWGSQESVRELATRGPQLVTDFLEGTVKTAFTRDPDGNTSYTGEAAHSMRRIAHFEDRTGEQIEQSLFTYATSTGVTILPNHTVIDLITNNHHSTDTQEAYRTREVMGAYALDNQTGEVKRLSSRFVILASGGIGNLYEHSTNPRGATGDGISMAYHAGADIIHAEFVQFHPTLLYHRDIKRFLISEALRGEGAKLVDRQGKPFMHKYSDQEDLAPRDVVSRAIFDQMARQGSDYVLLDLAGNYRESVPIEQRFPLIHETCAAGGIDITREPIPVVPGAHYFCGGIKTDLHGRTSLQNLYAIGEVSCTGVHGANRLASTSLLEGLLWAHLAAEDITEHIDETYHPERYASIPEWSAPSLNQRFDPLLIKQDWKAIQLTMWNYVGIIRTPKGLQRARADLAYYAHRIIQFYREAELNRDIIELRHAITASGIIAAAAQKRTRSIGCHFIQS